MYKCEICGNVVEVERIGAGTLVCCGQDMNLEKDNEADADARKHVPRIVEEDDGEGIKITIGEILHPMTEEHHIEWVQIMTPYGDIRVKLEVGHEPVVRLPFLKRSDIQGIRSYCNQHALYVS